MLRNEKSGSDAVGTRGRVRREEADDCPVPLCHYFAICVWRPMQGDDGRTGGSKGKTSRPRSETVGGAVVCLFPRRSEH